MPSDFAHDHEYVATTSATTVETRLVCRWCGKPHPTRKNLSPA